MLSKKGTDWGAVAKFILVIIALLILYNVIVYGYTTFITESGSKEACKNWVNLQSTEVLKEARLFNSPCVTTEETIKNKDIKTSSDVYEFLAKNMYDCWDMYGKGEQDFYKNIDFGSSENHCRICSEIKTDPNLEKNKREIDIDEFEIYLSNTHIPSSRQTYSDFFLNAENSKLDFGSGKIILDPSKELYTAFVVHKKSTPPDFWTLGGTPTTKELGFGGGGCIVGGGIGVGAGAVFAGIGAIPGAIGGCAIGFLGGMLFSVTGYSDYLFPSLTIFESDPLKLMTSCNSIYYKPINK